MRLIIFYPCDFPVFKPNDLSEEIAQMKGAVSQIGKKVRVDIFYFQYKVNHKCYRSLQYGWRPKELFHVISFANLSGRIGNNLKINS